MIFHSLFFNLFFVTAGLPSEDNIPVSISFKLVMHMVGLD